MAILFRIPALIALTILLLFGGAQTSQAQPNPAKGDEWLIATWNLCNFGKSKSAQEITFIAAQLRSMDVVAIQEVSVSDFGAQAVAKLSEALSLTGAQWEYVISDPTSGDGSERYAFLWKSSRISLIARPQGTRGILATALADSINREPYLVRFSLKQKQENTPSGEQKNVPILTFANYHAVPSAKKPQREITFLGALPALFPNETFIILGDFNLSPKKKEAYASLWVQSFTPVFPDQKTSLKREPADDGSYLYERYDNILYPKGKIAPKETGIIDFVPKFESLKEARAISDHLPIWFKFTITP